jgi:two-component system, OmpR family, response regulator RegX3
MRDRKADVAAISVLVVDDEPAFREALRIALQREGFTVHTAETGPDALDRFAAVGADIVLLDVLLPGMSGLDVCRKIRAVSPVPIIMVSAKGEEIDAVVGLEVGADDYVTKPYRFRELVARMRSVIRRTADRRDASAEMPGVLEVGPLQLDRGRHELRRDGTPLALPLKEFELLAELMECAGQVVTRQELLDRVWGYDYVGDGKTLDVHVKRLRARIEDDPAEPTLLTTIRGLGYKLVPPAG